MPDPATAYHGPPVTLYRGDALEVMRGLPDGSIDCVLTDPPYCSGGVTEASRGAATHQGLRSDGIRIGRFAWFEGDVMTTPGLTWLLREVAALETMFAAEMRPGSGVRRLPARVARQLEARGLAEAVERRVPCPPLGHMTVRGHVLTHAGRMAYGEACEGGPEPGEGDGPW